MQNHPSSPRPPRSASDAVQQAWESALHEVKARTSDHQLPSIKWFQQLPWINQWLLGSGTASILIGLFCVIGIPILMYVNLMIHSAVYPYTDAGKRQSCMTNLQRLSLVVAQYRKDYDDRLPIAEYPKGVGSQKSRMTWVAQLQPYSLGPFYLCPTQYRGHSDGVTVSSYGINPILAGQAFTRVANPEESLLLADRDEAHDSLLFPPYVSWPVVSNTKDVTYDSANLEYRHSEGGPHTQAAALYVDGHADTISRGGLPGESEVWGGALVWNTSLERLQTLHPLLSKILDSSPKQFNKQRDKLRIALGDLYQLEKQTQSERYVHEDIERGLWKGAGILRVLGDTDLEKQLYTDLHIYSQTLQNESLGDWQKLESSYGFTILYPNGWKSDVETDGRYKTTYFRSASPYIEALVEHGERQHPSAATTIDWTGMEFSLKKRFGNGYRRIRMDYAVLGGQSVSVWECFLKKPDGPKLRKIYFGRSSTWNSTILVCMAPANCYSDWKSTFDQIQNGFEFRW